MPFDGLLTEISTPTKADITRLRHRAADLIEHRGHCQHCYWDLDGHTCLMNALYEAETGNDLGDQYFGRSPLVQATIVSLGLNGYPGICSYNNTHTAIDGLIVDPVAAQVRREAAAYLMRNGWCQWTLSDPAPERTRDEAVARLLGGLPDAI